MHDGFGVVVPTALGGAAGGLRIPVREYALADA